MTVPVINASDHIHFTRQYNFDHSKMPAVYLAYIIL